MNDHQEWVLWHSTNHRSLGHSLAIVPNALAHVLVQSLETGQLCIASLAGFV